MSAASWVRNLLHNPCTSTILAASYVCPMSERCIQFLDKLLINHWMNSETETNTEIGT